MTKWGPLWNGDTSSPRFAAMVEMTWLGVRTWEEVLLMPDMPWAQYVTPEQRRGLKRFVDACPYSRDLVADRQGTLSDAKK